MPTKKQRRRQEKLRRHEWEEVWVDEEGQEVDAPPDAAGETAAARPARQAATKSTARKGSSGRSTRKPPTPPSWERVARRGAIFAPLMFVVVYYLQKGSHRSFAAALYQTAILMLFFVPFSYLMDRAMYRTYLKRTGAAPPPAKKKSGD